MLDIKHPVKKKGIYVAKILADNAPLRITIPFTRVVHRSDGILRLWVPDESSVTETLSRYDEYCLAKTLEHNNEWFSNTLAEDTIQAYFRKSISKNILGVVVSEVRPPQVFYKRKHIENLDLLLDIDLSNHSVSVELEAQGLYFLSKRFGIRWLVRTIKMEEDKDEPEYSEEHRKEVEELWEMDVKTLSDKIRSDITMYKNNIQILKNLDISAHSLLSAAKNQVSCGPEWNSAFSELTGKMAKYYNGTIFICNKI